MVGQQHTVLIDGAVINQFDNSVPHIASRNGDPPTPARQFPTGYFGLQTHGGTDRIFYREIRVKDLGQSDVPSNVEAPSVSGTGQVGRPLMCDGGRWQGARRIDYSWFRATSSGRTIRTSAPEPGGPRPFHCAGGPAVRDAAAAVRRAGGGRQGQVVRAERGRRLQARLLPRDRGGPSGADAWKTASARRSVGR